MGACPGHYGNIGFPPPPKEREKGESRAEKGERWWELEGKQFWCCGTRDQ